MKYDKPTVEVVLFEDNALFMAESPIYSDAQSALAASCGGYNGGKTNNFSCTSFGGYNESNPPTQHSTVSLGGGIYVFDYVGNHWKCDVV